METIQIEDVSIIDTYYYKEGLACAYLVKENQKGAIIETNTNHAIPYILQEIEKQNLKPDDIEWIIITHVHLDHAGGAGLLMQKCKNAKLIAHPNAAKHIVDPSRLIASSIQVYGEENFKKLYGDIIPVPKERVIIPEDNEEISFGSRKFKFIYTKGHANHHFVIYDSKTKSVFSGDSFGIAYPILQEKGTFLYPTTTPTDFDPKEAIHSIEKILNTNPNKIFLTHYGAITDLHNAKQQLLEGLDFAEQLLEWDLKNTSTDQEKIQYIKNSIMDYYKQKMNLLKLELTKQREEMLELDAQLNAMGIHVAATRKRKKG
ncbi:MAG: MBL fold metallo-hydrolase [Leptonema sp. (in: bacteria)]